MFATADDAKAQIVTAIEAGDAAAADFDIDQIFDATFEYSGDLQAFVQIADEAAFWTAVQKAAK